MDYNINVKIKILVQLWKQTMSFRKKMLFVAISCITLQTFSHIKEEDRLKDRENRLIETGLFTQATVPPVILPIKKYENTAAYCLTDHIGIRSDQSNAVLLHEACHWIENHVQNQTKLNQMLYFVSMKTVPSLPKLLAPFLYGNYHERRADNFACQYATVEELIEFCFFFASCDNNQKKTTSKDTLKDFFKTVVMGKKTVALRDEHPTNKSRMIKVIDALIEKTTPEEMTLLLEKNILKNANDQDRDTIQKVADQYRQKLTDKNKIAVLNLFIAFIQKK